MAQESSSFVKLGSGLVEIAALTALIGSATAESLTLGNKGAPGLAWAASSTFGALSVVKACVAGATPGWLRDSLGVRNSTTNLAIGLSFDLESRYKDREDMARKNLGDPIGVMCEGYRPSINKRESPVEDAAVARRDIYAFDQFTMNPVQNVSASLPGEPLNVHIFIKDPWYNGPAMTKDWIGLLVSLLKASETYVLWRYDARPLCWISGCSWLYFFTASTVLLQQKMSREYGKNFDNGRLDILTGQLPTARKKGGERVVLLGAPRNFRHHMLWRIVWTIGSIVCATSLVISYILLSRADVTVTYIWVAFQVLWLVLRSIFFHVAQGTNSIHCPILEQRPFEKLHGSLKRRTLDLVFAMSKCQIHGHPRGIYSYAEDLASFEDVKNSLTRNAPQFEKSYPMDLVQNAEGIPELFFASVIGDTLLSSAAWVQGSNLSGIDLYDSCIATFKIGHRYLSIPCARALCTSSLAVSRDIESGDLARYSPKGTPNHGPQTVQWYYWIPCSDGRWIQARSEEMKVLGKRQVRLLTDSEVTESLKSGELNISMLSVDVVKDMVRFSTTTCQILLQLMT